MAINSRQSNIYPRGLILWVCVMLLVSGDAGTFRPLGAQADSEPKRTVPLVREFPTEPEALAKYVDQIGQSLMKVVADPNQDFKLRERAALIIADLRYSPGIPTLQENFYLTYFKDGVWDEDHPEPCQYALGSFRSAGFLSLIKMCRVREPRTTSLPSPMIMLRQLERRRDAAAILQLDIETETDPDIKARLEREWRSLKDVSQHSKEWRFITFGEKMPEQK